MIVIADTTPIISLLKIGRLDLLQKLFGEVLIPEAVFLELTQNLGPQNEAEIIFRADFIKSKKVSNKIKVTLLENNTMLDKGESEAIVLFMELNAQLLLMDERRGRKIAGQLNIPLTGTIGILLAAFDKGFITGQQIYEYMEIFKNKNRRYSSKLMDLVREHINKHDKG